MAIEGDHEPDGPDGIDTRMLRAAAASRLFGETVEVRIGRYAVLDRLGSGGMGVVYAVHDAELDRKIAVKLLLDKVWSGDTRGRERMRREAQAMAKLNHPNVAQVHEVGDHEGNPYVAMEFVEGVTLRAWASASTRPWRDVLAVYLQAARGLAAAHAVGLVHRDFKPDNAMLGSDDRVRVMDFGLARGIDRDEPVDHDASGDDGAITRSSVVGGTPAYMAAEQFAGEPGDARVDQFAFCVSVWEALTGQRPFAGATVYELANAVQKGAIDPHWPDRVPRWLRGVLVRGLAVDPARRWPDMPALVAALEDDPWRRRKRWLALAGVVFAAGAVLVGLRVRRDRQLAACDAEAAAIEEQWSSAIADELRAGLVATGSPDAGAAFDRARPWIDDFADKWRALRREQCVLAKVERTRDAALADASIACLEHRRSALGGVMSVWAEPDVLLVQRLVNAATGLPDPQRCGDDGYVVRRTPPPEDRELAEQVVALRRRIDRARALETAGRMAPALEEARATRTQAEALGWGPLLAEATAEVGRLADRTGASAEAEVELRKAFSLAHAHGADETAAATAIALTYALANSRKPDEALEWSSMARAAVERIGETEGTLGANWELTTGYAHQQRGDFERALEHYQRAIEIREALFGKDHPSVAIAYQHVGMTEYSREHAAEARAAFERTAAINLAVFGEHHPSVAHARDALGTLLGEQGDYDAALELLQKAHLSRVREFGEKSLWVAHSLHNIGNVWLGKNRHREALDHYERAAALFRELRGPDHPDLVNSHANVGLARSALGERPAALAAFREALRIQQATLGPDHPDTARVHVYLANELLRAGELQESLTHAETGSAIAEKAFGPDHSRTIDAVQARGEALVRLGRSREAIPLLERALAADGKVVHDPRDGGYTRFSLARALWDAQSDRERAIDLARQAEKIFAADGTRDETLDEIRTWLAAHAR